MNFLLVISVCSFITGNCFVVAESNIQYNTWNECMQDALIKSSSIMKEIPEKDINKLKLATKYFCYEEEKTKV